MPTIALVDDDRNILVLTGDEPCEDFTSCSADLMIALGRSTLMNAKQLRM